MYDGLQSVSPNARFDDGGDIVIAGGVGIVEKLFLFMSCVTLATATPATTGGSVWNRIHGNEVVG